MAAALLPVILQYSKKVLLSRAGVGDSVYAVRGYGCQSDQIQSYVRSRLQPSGCLDDEDVARRATNNDDDDDDDNDDATNKLQERSAGEAEARLTCLPSDHVRCYGDCGNSTESVAMLLSQVTIAKHLRTLPSCGYRDG